MDDDLDYIPDRSNQERWIVYKKFVRRFGSGLWHGMDKKRRDKSKKTIDRQEERQLQVNQMSYKTRNEIKREMS